MPRHINLRQVEAFKAVIENGTTSRAAELLNISQPAISRLIADLEFDTGLRLFDRVKGRLAPTEHGVRFYHEVERIFSGVRQLDNAVVAIRREEQGRLAIGVMTALAGSFIQRVTTDFLDDHKKVFCSVLALNSELILDWLITRKLDVGLVSARVDNPYLVLEPLLSLPLVCVMTPTHPLAAKSHVEPKDLDGLPFLGFPPDTYVGRLIDRMLDTNKIAPSVVLTSNVSTTLSEFAAAGLGVALVHPLMMTGLEHRLTARRFEPEIPFHFQLCRAADSRRAKLVDAFADTVRTTATRITRSLMAGS